MTESITDVSIIVQLLSLIILVTTTLTLVVAAFSYAGYKLRKRVPLAEVGEAPVYFERYSPGAVLKAGVAPTGTPAMPRTRDRIAE